MAALTLMSYTHSYITGTRNKTTDTIVLHPYLYKVDHNWNGCTDTIVLHPYLYNQEQDHWLGEKALSRSIYK